MTEQRLNAEDVRRLYNQHGPALVAYAFSFLPDAAAAEDAVHGVFLRMLRSRIAMPEQPAGYLFRAVRNAALNFRRDSVKDAPLEESCFVHQGGNREAVLALQQALGELPEEQREVVIMRIWGGLTLAETAEAAGILANTASSRYRYALEKLREKLRPWQARKFEKEQK